MKKKILFLSLILIFGFLSVGAGCEKPWSLTGRLEVKSDPSGAEIFIDEQDKNVVTPYTFDLKAGNYSLRLTKGDFKDYEEEVTIKRGETTTVEAELELLNPNIHKEVYKQAQEKVAFPVVYPTYLPEGFELEGDPRVGESGDVDPETGAGDYGSIVVTYKKETSKVQIMQGTGDIGNVENIKDLTLKNGEGWLWRSGGYLGITLSQSTDNYSYLIMGEGMSEEELVRIANSIF